MEKINSEKIIKVFFIIVMFFTFPLFLFSGDFSLTESMNIPDSSTIRKDLIDSWFDEPLSYVRMNKAEFRKNACGNKFKIYMEEDDSCFTVLVSPETTIDIDVYNAAGETTVPSKVYPGDAPGSWMLIRDKKTGKPLHIRYYFMPDSDIFIQFNPCEQKNRTTVDMSIYNCYTVKDIKIGIPFSTFYSASFKQVYELTKNILPWQDVTVYRKMYHSPQQMIATIRENLSDIVYVSDAMYDEKGSPVYISDGKDRKISEKNIGKLSLSSAGFVKWIVDGMIEPLTGSYLKRVPLLQSTVDYKKTGFQGIISSKYKVSFTLDWIRNLAAAEFSVRMKRTYHYKDTGVDVTITPFAAIVNDSSFENMNGYIKNSGYIIKFVKPLMYVLAATEPLNCYLCAVRKTDTSVAPEVNVFNDCAVFFPYFDSTGRFRCSVFEKGKELSLDDFTTKYEGDFVYFTRLETTDIYSPQEAAAYN